MQYLFLFVCTLILVAFTRAAEDNITTLNYCVGETKTYSWKPDKIIDRISIFTLKKEEIARSTNLSKGWNAILTPAYKGRLSLSMTDGTLQLVCEDIKENDTNLYKTVLTYEDGKPLIRLWNITVEGCETSRAVSGTVSLSAVLALFVLLQLEFLC